uniref:Uncharacterized protein n=1 Tax=Fagus sylvatica TaxID=28930 RepID=A0A2N9FJY8_FAGSY
MMQITVLDDLGCAASPRRRVREIVTRDGPIMVAWPFPSPFPSRRLAGDFGWFEFPTDSLSFVGTPFPFQWASRSSTTVDVWRASDLGTTSSSRFYCLHYNWGRYFKTPLFEEPLPHPNRMAYLAMAN